MADGTQPFAEETVLQATIRKAVHRLADLDGIGHTQDFLSDLIGDLEGEVDGGDSARGLDERRVRVEEGRV